MDARPDDLDDLLAHEPFVRALARGLVLDGVRADDVVQQTWLAALRADRSRIESVRGWLAAVVRRVASTMRRAEARARSRERRAARPEADTPADDARAREDARRVIVEAVFALDEPWRTTLILRHLDGVPQREIARRLGVPVETVHSRLRRGLELLRLRLDAVHGGDRRSWLLGLVPLAARSGPIPLAALSTAVIPGALVMSVPLKAVVAAVAITALGCWWLTTNDGPRIESAGPSANRDDTASAPTSSPAAARDAAEVTEREVVSVEVPATATSPTVPDAATGAIEVSVRWRDPARDPIVVVQVAPAIDGLARPVRAPATGGFARFDRLAPGSYTVSTDRFVETTCVVEAGATVQVTLDLTVGYRISGRIVDPEGAGVAGATITLSRFGRWQEGFDVAVSGANGAYEVDGVRIGVHVGATKLGFAASMMRFVFAGRGESRGDIDLRLRPDGGAISGRVTDGAGAPIAGARIVVDADDVEYETSNDGTSYVHAFERFAWSAADGAFRADGLLAGDHRVVVRAPGYAPFAATRATRAGETATLEARLIAGAIVGGVVRRADGGPAAGVPVTAGREGVFSESSSVISDADGSFRLESLPAGRIVVVAGDAARGTARVEHDAIAGVEQRVDLLLASDPVVAGRVEDEFGRPVAEARLDARNVADGALLGSTSTASDGTFRIACRDAEWVDFDVFWRQSMVQPALRVRDVRVGAEDVVVRLPNLTRPSARIFGRIEDVAGPVAGAEVLILAADGPQGTVVLSTADGSFESPLLSPGRFLISVRSTARAVHTSSPIVLDANAEYDAGTIRLGAGGSLLVRLQRSPEMRDARPSVWLERADDGNSVFVEVVNDVGSATKIAAGLYVLSVGDAGTLAQSATVAIRDGEETRLDLTIAPAATSVLFAVAAPSIDAETIRVRIDDAGGRRIHAGTTFRMRRSDSFEHRIGLNPGAYRVTLEGPGGSTATREFVVEEALETYTFPMSLP